MRLMMVQQYRLNNLLPLECTCCFQEWLLIVDAVTEVRADEWRNISWTHDTLRGDIAWRGLRISHEERTPSEGTESSHRFCKRRYGGGFHMESDDTCDGAVGFTMMMALDVALG